MDKRLMQNLALVFVSILITFILLEIAVHIFIKLPRLDKQFTDTWWLGIPHKKGVYKNGEVLTHYEFNSLGFRDYDYSKDKSKGTCRIVILGDSFAETFEVELNNSWHKLLEKKLNDKEKGKFEVINFGTGGGGTTTEYFILNNYALEFKPDIVILLFFTGNDVNDNYFEPSGKYFKLNENNELVEVEPYNSFKFLRSLMRKSKLVVYLKMRYDLFRYRFGAEALKNYYGVFLSEYSDDWNRGWYVTKRVLSKIDDTAKKNNSTLVIAIANAKEQVDEKAWQSVVDANPSLSEVKWNFTKPNRILKDYCQQNSIVCLDPLDTFKKAVREGKKPYLEIDKHWNNLGNVIMADYVFENIDRTLATSCNRNV